MTSTTLPYTGAAASGGASRLLLSITRCSAAEADAFDGIMIGYLPRNVQRGTQFWVPPASSVLSDRCPRWIGPNRRSPSAGCPGSTDGG